MPVFGPNRFDRKNLFKTAVERNPQAKRALFFGDSWFQYPFEAKDLAKQIPRHFKTTLFFSRGVAGRDSAQWKRGLGEIQDLIREYDFDAILLSGGGNDVVGEELKEFVKKEDELQTGGRIDWGGPVPEVVRKHLRLDIFDKALGYAMADLGLVIKLRDRFSPRSFIYVHTYDQIFPDGRGFRGLTKAWVQPALKSVGLTDAGQQRELSNWLLAQFARRLEKLVGDNNKKSDNMRLINSLGTLTRPAQWENEIHPTDAGFRLIAEKCWVPVLREVLI
jgi:hypothetical protein